MYLLFLLFFRRKCPFLIIENFKMWKSGMLQRVEISSKAALGILEGLEHTWPRSHFSVPAILFTSVHSHGWLQWWALIYQILTENKIIIGIKYLNFLQLVSFVLAPSSFLDTFLSKLCLIRDFFLASGSHSKVKLDKLLFVCNLANPLHMC